MSEFEDARSGKRAMARRKHIWNEVRSNGQISLEQLRDAGHSTKSNIVNGDKWFFEEMDLGVKYYEDSKRFVLHSSNYWIFDYRKGERKEQKTAVGWLTACIIWGHYTKSVLAMLNEQSRNDDVSKKVGSYLHSFWGKLNRWVTIDSGTTTFAVAEYLRNSSYTDVNSLQKKYSIEWGWVDNDGISPLSAEFSSGNDSAARKAARNTENFRPPSSLTVVTNSPEIEEVFRDPMTTPHVVSLGGELRKQTAAHTGLLCDQIFDMWNFRSDISVIGTTALNEPRNQNDGGKVVWGFASDTPEESRTKGKLLERSDFRIIVMDSEKFGRKNSASIFASLNPNFVDLIVTDHDAPMNYINGIWSNGVAVLKAPKFTGPGGKSVQRKHQTNTDKTKHLRRKGS
jgi:DeoR/GlpR family transcriptional regulator of sugar metabolism